MSTDFQQIAPFHLQAQDIGDFLIHERAREAASSKHGADRPVPSEPLQSD